MIRSIFQLSRGLLLALITLVTLSCASGMNGGNGQPKILPIPNQAELTSWLGTNIQADKDRPDFFIQMADTQLGMSEYSLLLLLFKSTFRDDEFAQDARKFEAAIAHANRLRPAFVVICGDLVHRMGHVGQIAEFQRIAATLDSAIPLHLVAGNHDVAGEPTAATLSAYREQFGRDWYSFEDGGILGLVLNSQLIDSPTHVPEDAAQQLAWVRETLADARSEPGKRIVVFQHQPFFATQADEPKSLANIEPNARARYLELFREFGVEAIFAGHLHKNAHGRDGDLEMVTTGAIGKPLGNDPSGFRIVAIEEGGLRHKYYSLGGN